MGDKFKTGEAPEAVTKAEEDSELLTQEPKEEVVDEYEDPFVEDENVPIPDLTEPCSLCGVECPNKEMLVWQVSHRVKCQENSKR